MKKKQIILPLLALVMGSASAFTSTPAGQMGWYKSGSTVQQGVITIPADTDTQPCAIGQSTVCRVGFFPAHSTEQGARTNDPLTLLKYN